MSVDGEQTPRAFLQEQFNESAPKFSPSGGWLAYESDESGRREIYVRPYPNAPGKRQVSTNGGASPRWRGDGSELFYLAGDELMVVDVEIQEKEFSLGAPRPLFTHATYGGIYDVTPDGQHFVMIDESVSDPAPTHLVVVQNWTEELSRLVPLP